MKCEVSLYSNSDTGMFLKLNYKDLAVTAHFSSSLLGFFSVLSVYALTATNSSCEHLLICHCLWHHDNQLLILSTISHCIQTLTTRVFIRETLILSTRVTFQTLLHNSELKYFW